MQKYKWNIDYIASMNPWQQLLAASADVSSVEDDVVHFATMAEYDRWMAERNT